MASVVGVRFREIGKIYTFDPGEFSLHRGDHVIVETSKGIDYGTVVLGNYELHGDPPEQPYRPVLRMASAEDTEKVMANKAREHEALLLCRQKVAERKLEMKVIAAEYTFDDSKLLFFFTADGRVDFRELVKDLASVFRMRIELRQVGVRDETKIVGGMGSCGRPLCCHTWLPDFVPVSIKMAKEQNLSLNPQKISGVCGRLLCCLKNEADTYAYLNSQLPKKGDLVALEDGHQGEITEVNVLKQTVRVLVLLDDDEREMRELPASETEFIAHRKKGQPSQLKKDAMARREAALQEARARKNEEGEDAGRRPGRRRDGGYSEPKEARGNREGRDARENAEERENREFRENREPRENRENREPRENREYRENRENREGRVPREARRPRENRAEGEGAERSQGGERQNRPPRRQGQGPRPDNKGAGRARRK